MARFITILLLTSILLQSFSKVIIYVNYEINLDYIIRTYCVNKDNPSRHCDGKCHLTKQMQEDNKREGIPDNYQKEKLEIQWFSEDGTDFLLKSYADHKYTYPILNVMIPVFPSLSIFHPPTEITFHTNSII